VGRRLLTRLGFAAVGALYIAVGLLAARVAFFGARGGVAGVPGTLRFLLRLPGGDWIVISLSIGLGGFAILRFSQAWSRRRRVLARGGHALAGVGYAALAWSAVRLLLPLGHTQDRSPRAEAAWLLSHSWGRTGLETAGVIVVGVGLFEIYQAWSGRLKERFAKSRLSVSAARFATRSARFGLAARGVVLLVIGYFLIRSVKDFDPGEVREMGGALRTLSRSPLGPAAMGVVALGLVGYGFYMWVLAVFQRPR
jgi:hypothetical protein